MAPRGSGNSGGSVAEARSEDEGEPEFADDEDCDVDDISCKPSFVLNRGRKCIRTPRCPCLVSVELLRYTYFVAHSLFATPGDQRDHLSTMHEESVTSLGSPSLVSAQRSMVWRSQRKQAQSFATGMPRP